MTPAVGQVWRERDEGRYGGGHERRILITSVGKTASGTQARVASWFEGPDNHELNRPLAGVMYVDRIVAEFEYLYTEGDPT